jgi:hypothetical protein
MHALPDAVADDPDVLGQARGGRGENEQEANHETAQRHSITKEKRFSPRKHVMVNDG